MVGTVIINRLAIQRSCHPRPLSVYTLSVACILDHEGLYEQKRSIWVISPDHTVAALKIEMNFFNHFGVYARHC